MVFSSYKFRFFCGLICIAASAPVLAEVTFPPYVGLNSIEARRNLEKIAGFKPEQISDTEKAEWVKARMALIALNRLERKEDEALSLFAGCGAYCERFGAAGEWQALKSWACARKKKALPCQLLEKTKAQKPPR